jgi:hypothetical protein
MRFRLIEDHQGVWPVRVVCDGAERVAVGLLRVAVTAGQPAQDRQSRAVGRYPTGSCAALGTIRSAARPRRTASRGSNRQRKRVERVMRQHGLRARGAAPLSRVHNRQQAFPPGGGKPAGSELCRRPAQSSLVGRYHLHSDQRGLALPGRDPRPVHPQGGGLGHAPPATTATSCSPPLSSNR